MLGSPQAIDSEVTWDIGHKKYRTRSRYQLSLPARLGPKNHDLGSEYQAIQQSIDSHRKLQHERRSTSLPARVHGSSDSKPRRGLRIQQDSTYDVPGTRLQLGLYTYIRQNIFSESAAAGYSLKLYARPYLNYQMTSTLAATVWTDLIQLSQARADRFLSMTNAPIDIEPGINWDVTPSISLNP